MNRVKLMMVLLMGCLFSAWGGAVAQKADQVPFLTVHFEPGKAILSDTDKSELRRLFESYSIGPQGRVFVVGYADGKGTKIENHKLSRQRAETVRREIIGTFGIDAGTVLALGKGANSPLADNKTAKGRALNRRAEIYLANGQVRKPQRPLGPDDPYWSDIQNLVRDAEELIKERQLEGALLKLKKAHALGADRCSDWHAVFGIAGYYTAASPVETRAHLVAALNLDAYNFKAREFLSRMDARQKVSRAEVTKDMGHTIETAIGVSSIAQQYEYLRLFEVEPLVHRQLEGQPVDMWQGVDQQGAPVVYYFNHVSAYQWAFTQASSDNASLDAQAVQAEHSSDNVWESKRFK